MGTNAWKEAAHNLFKLKEIQCGQDTESQEGEFNSCHFLRPRQEYK